MATADSTASPTARRILEERPSGQEVRAFISNDVDVVTFFQALKSAGLRAQFDRRREALVIEPGSCCAEQEVHHHG